MRPVLIALIVSLAVVGAAGAYLHSNPDLIRTTDAAKKETTYERIARTGTIRCGYTVWDPLFYIDTKTNEKMGIFHDMMEEVGKRLGYKVVWQEELGWGTVVESVRTGRVDMACAGYWLNPARIKNILPSTPQLYSPMYIWMRQDEARPLKTPDDLNAEQYTAAVTDGDAAHQILDTRFAIARKLNLPELSTSSDLIENLVTGKADFIIVDATTMAAYLANNPGKIKNIFPDQPMNLFPTVMLLPPDDFRLKDVIDNTLKNAEYDGTLDAILKKYHMDKGFLRNPPPVAISR
jgi:polar amino acid transport system substrate-binding protein